MVCELAGLSSWPCVLLLLGGFFNNGLPFSLSMGCGSWGGNSIDGNLNWEHFVNKVRVVQTIEENKPDLEEIFGNYWEETSQ